MKLREWLDKEKISTKYMAKVLDIHSNHLYLILKGERFPGYHLAKNIEEVTKGEVTVDEIIRKDVPRPRCPCCGRKIWSLKKTLE